MRLVGADGGGSGTKVTSGRKRVLSFMSQFSGGHRDLSKSPPSSLTNSTPASSPPREDSIYHGSLKKKNSRNNRDSRGTGAAKPDPAAVVPESEPFPTLPTSDLSTPSSLVQRPSTSPRTQARSTPDCDASLVNSGSPSSTSGSPAAGGRRRQRNNSQRPLSLVQTYQPPLMDVTEDTIPELQPIFTFLNSHANKLYQEGYFLKLDDQNTQGRPNPDRTWTECFAQLVGTILSFWDAAELDAAGEDGEVLPKFINLTDASIKMIESLPTRSNDEQPLQNILSISTAGRNRYLLHFNSHQSLIQWTAAIRLAMYEHSTLQEAYTGALIAGKGKSLNNINIIMERARHKTEAWVRVRFGAGVPWRRCWCVINPPDEKEYQKQQKELKKRSPYDRSAVPTLKGDIRFYDTKVEGKKQKKTKPIASIVDSYSAYAIYPQAKSLVDASTLLKIEGNITIHSEPPSSTEGFVFVMPEAPPMVSGFEMLLRFLFPTWDTFGLYGRPGRLVASTLDLRSLMFAMPKHRRYGYLDIQDVSGLILTQGSSSWAEREWRKQLKELTGQKMNSMDDSAEPSKSHSRSNSRRSNRLSFNGNGSPPKQPRPRVGFSDEGHAAAHNPPDPNMHNYTAFRPQPVGGFENEAYMNTNGQRQPVAMRSVMPGRAGTMEGMSSDDEQFSRHTPPPLESMRNLQTPEPVSQPPAFNHGPRSRPVSKPYHSPELRKANSRLSNSTLSHLANAGGLATQIEDHAGGPYSEGRSGGDSAAFAQPSVHPHASPIGAHANENGPNEAMMPPGSAPPAMPPLNQQRSRPQLAQPAYGPPPSPGPRSPMVPNHHQQGGPGGPLQPPHSGNFSRPDGARTPPAGGPERARTPETRGRGYGQPPPHFQEHAVPQTPTVDASAARGGHMQRSPPIHRKPVGEGIPASGQPIHRQLSERSAASSRYDDGSSVASPDYASTHRSVETHESVERPRAGVLKTVGSEPPVPPVPHASGYDIPDVDFGPTINYGASPRKQPATMVNPDGHRPYSPAVAARHNADGMNDAARAARRPGTAHGERSETPSNQAYNRRSKTPEPFTGRRRSSQELLTHLRRKSADLLQRPGSRGANHGFGIGSSGEMTSHLSAREQEQIARMTGAPLVGVAGRGADHRPQSPGGSGLVGTIEARERERQHMRQGLSNQAAQAVQHAAYRQQQPMHQQPPFPQQGYSQPVHGQPGWHPNPHSMTRGGSPGPYGSPRPQQQPPHGGGPMPPPQQGGGYRPMPGPPGRMRQGPPPPLGPMPPLPHGHFGGGSRPQSPASPYGPRPQPGYRPPHPGHAF